MAAKEILERWRQIMEAGLTFSAENESRHCMLFLDGSTGSWEFTLGPRPDLHQADCSSASNRLSLDSATLEMLDNGELTPQAAFLSGRLRLDMPANEAIQLSKVLREVITRSGQ